MFGQLDYRKSLSVKLVIVLLVAWIGICLWRILVQDASIDLVTLLLSGAGVEASFWISMMTELQMGMSVTTAGRCRQGAESRTERVTGTVIGGQPSGGILIGEQTHAMPVVEFQVRDEKFRATGPRPRSIRIVQTDETKPKWDKGDILHVPSALVVGDERICKADTDNVIATYYSNDIRSKDDWSSWRYGQSVFSKLFPIGSEVEVAYDPDNPKGNHSVITPNETEPFSGGAFTSDTLVRMSCMLLIALGTALLSLAILLRA